MGCMSRWTMTIAVVAALTLIGCGGDGDGDSGGSECVGVDVPLTGSCLNGDCGSEGVENCMEYRGAADPEESFSSGCEMCGGTWSTSSCPEPIRARGGCVLRATETMTPADPEVGAYSTSYHPDMGKDLCRTLGGCWVK